MQLLQSLFCWQGADNRSRYTLINSMLLLSFIVLTTVISSSNILNVLVLLFLVVVQVTSIRRRMKDSDQKSPWLFASSLLFLIIGSVVIFSQNSLFNWLLILPTITLSLLLTFTSKGNKRYILGYYGPIDLSNLVQSQTIQRTNRVEPTLAGESAISSPSELVQNSSYFESEAVNDIKNEQPKIAGDIGETIRSNLLKYKKIVIPAVVILMIIIISSLFFATQLSEEIIEAPISNQETAPAIDRLHPLDMPDNFTVQLSQHGGLFVSWQIDTSEDRTLWSLNTAIGDKSCSSIKFSRGKEIRSINAVVENKSDIFVSFSPLDTEEIVRSLAKKNTFSLCGYEFSLKGSQAVIGKHREYAEFMTYSG